MSGFEVEQFHKEVEKFNFMVKDHLQIFLLSYLEKFLQSYRQARLFFESGANAVLDHFVDINKMIRPAKGAIREVQDIALMRYACYLIAKIVSR
jgi:DNA-damage-inducible protein D